MSAALQNEKLKLTAYAWTAIGAGIATGGVLTPVVKMAIGDAPTADQQWSIFFLIIASVFCFVILYHQAQLTLDEWVDQ